MPAASTFCGLYSNGPNRVQLTHGIADAILKDLGAKGALHHNVGPMTTVVYYDEVALSRTDHERVPARPAARFECDQVLMPQLVDDLPRRDAALRRRADHERVPAGPPREIGQRSAERRQPVDEHDLAA